MIIREYYKLSKESSFGLGMVWGSRNLSEEPHALVLFLDEPIIVKAGT